MIFYIFFIAAFWISTHIFLILEKRTFCCRIGVIYRLYFLVVIHKITRQTCEIIERNIRTYRQTEPELCNRIVC